LWRTGSFDPSFFPSAPPWRGFGQKDLKVLREKKAIASMLDQPDRQDEDHPQKGEAFFARDSTRFERGSVAPARRSSRSEAIAPSTVPV